jgi:glutathione S-transferase
MVKLNVYGNAKSTCTQRILILLEELDLKYNFNEIDLSKQEHKTEEYRKKQPFGKVPYIEYGEKTIFESRSILRYISKNNREPEDFYGDVYTDMWLEAESQNFHPFISKIIYEKMFKKGEENKDIIEKNLEELEKILDVYNEILAGRDYIAGEQYTIADMSHIPYAYYFLKSGYKDILKKRINVYNWLKRIMRRESVKRVLEGRFLEERTESEIESDDE